MFYVRLRISGQYSYLQAALLVLVIYYMGEFLLGGVLFFVHYNGKCLYLYFRYILSGSSIVIIDGSCELLKS